MMDLTLELKRSVVSSGATLYRALPTDNIETFIASTSQTSQILIQPEICGAAFQTLLSEALVHILRMLQLAHDSRLALALGSGPLDVLYILRGGLNFDLHRGLLDVTGTLPEVSFISSQRLPAFEGFRIGETGFEKWSIQDKSLLCIGDIGATSVTLKSALERAATRYNEEGKRPRWLLFVTIGTSQVLQMLKVMAPLLRQSWEAVFEGVAVVFLEEVFFLYEGHPHLAVEHLPFTDLFRLSYPRTLEFERASLSSPICYLERCAIYDGGARAFEPRVYLRNLRTYWESLGKRDRGLSLIHLLELKSDLLDYRLNFVEWLRRRGYWSGIDQSELRSVHDQGTKALDALMGRPLSEICDERLTQIRLKQEGIHNYDY